MISLLLAAALSGRPSVSAEQLPATPPPAQMPQMINLSLMEGLVAVGEQDLAGVFGFVPEASSAAAFAQYLLRNRSGLNRFVKKSERDLKETHGINAWDKQVYMYVIQVSGSELPPDVEKLPQKLEYRISSLVLAPSLSLQELSSRRVR